MKHNGHAAEAVDLDGERLGGVGAFIWQERERIRAAAARQILDDGAPAPVECRLRGGSMAAAIPQGSRIRITLSRGPHRIGDIVAFMIGERIVVYSRFSFAFSSAAWLAFEVASAVCPLVRYWA